MAFAISLITAAEYPRSPFRDGIRDLHIQLFGADYTARFEERFGTTEKFTLFVAHRKEGEVLGFKSGYQLNESKYYSWTGGVSARVRKQGIASALMAAQHKWCQEQGYSTVQTKTKNQWREMLILNLKHGFNIVGVYPSRGTGRPKIVLEKSLDPLIL